MKTPGLGLAAIVLLGLALAFFALQPPPPREADAPASDFSAVRAYADIQTIAQRPHPTGSAEAARVRVYLVQRMGRLGVSPKVSVGGAANIVGVLPGFDPNQPAIVLMAHSDSVATGPGAADDAAGVAAALEIVRALKATGPHRRDVMVVITDGEEAGLRGAEAFFDADPMAARVGVVLNMEARGNRGRAVMFETHREAGGMISALSRQGALRGASSLMPDLYRRLPNDTDLSVVLRAGHQGLNFAFFGGQAAYHTALDTPQNLDLGSVQHMGDQVLAAAAVLADAPVLPPRGPDLVYGDVLGGPVLAYPPAAGWLILAASAGLGLAATAAAVRAGRASWMQIGGGAAAFAALTVALLAALTLAGMAMMAAHGGGGVQFQKLLLAYPSVLSGCALLAGGLSLLILAGAGRLLRASPAAFPLGTLLAGWAAAALLQAAAPFDAFILAWPVLAAAVIAAAGALPGPPAVRLGIRTAVALAGLAQVAYWAGLMFALVGVELPAVLGLFATLGVMILAPWAAEAAPDRRAPALALLACLAGTGLLAAAAH